MCMNVRQLCMTVCDVASLTMTNVMIFLYWLVSALMNSGETSPFRDLGREGGREGERGRGREREGEEGGRRGRERGREREGGREGEEGRGIKSHSQLKYLQYSFYTQFRFRMKTKRSLLHLIGHTHHGTLFFVS